MSLKAYQQTQVKTEDPRATEYRLFGQVTGAPCSMPRKRAPSAHRWSRRLTGTAGCGAPWPPTAWTIATA